jgi:hypothetical protein
MQVGMLNIGLGIGCLLVAALMTFWGAWFVFNGFKEREWGSVILDALGIGLACFAIYGAVNLFLGNFP